MMFGPPTGHSHSSAVAIPIHRETPLSIEGIIQSAVVVSLCRRTPNFALSPAPLANNYFGFVIPGAYAPGFMLLSAPRTHPVATAPGSDLKHFSCLIVLEGKWMGC